MQGLKDRIPMHPAVIWNSIAVLSLTENRFSPFHMKHQWILGAGSLFRSRRGGGCELRHGNFCTASSNQNVTETSIRMLYFSFTYDGNYVKFTPITILLAGSCILYLHIIMCDILAYNYMCSLLSRSAFHIVHVTA